MIQITYNFQNLIIMKFDSVIDYLSQLPEVKQYLVRELNKELGELYYRQGLNAHNSVSNQLINHKIEVIEKKKEELTGSDLP